MTTNKIKIYLGADHRGYELKEKVAKWLFDHKYDYEDVGALSFQPNDDYSKYAAGVASLVADGGDEARGILFCGSGVGVDVVANKFDGVRAAIGLSSDQVAAGRKDDNMNVLVIAADFSDKSDVYKMVEAFLEIKYQKNTRHERRLGDITKIEANN